MECGYFRILVKEVIALIFNKQSKKRYPSCTLLCPIAFTINYSYCCTWHISLVLSPFIFMHTHKSIQMRWSVIHKAKVIIHLPPLSLLKLVVWDSGCTYSLTKQHHQTQGYLLPLFSFSLSPWAPLPHPKLFLINLFLLGAITKSWTIWLVESCFLFGAVFSIVS